MSRSFYVLYYANYKCVPQNNPRLETSSEKTLSNIDEEEEKDSSNASLSLSDLYEVRKVVVEDIKIPCDGVGIYVCIPTSICGVKILI